MAILLEKFPVSLASDCLHPAIPAIAVLTDGGIVSIRQPRPVILSRVLHLATEVALASLAWRGMEFLAVKAEMMESCLH